MAHHLVLHCLQKYLFWFARLNGLRTWPELKIFCKTHEAKTSVFLHMFYSPFGIFRKVFLHDTLHRRSKFANLVFQKKSNILIFSYSFGCLFVCGGFTAQSTQWGHVERGQFTLPHVYWAGLTSIVHILSPETDNCPS